MPRPTRAQGRPGTRVFPKNWETEHAVVVRKTCTALIKIWAPAPAGVAPTNDQSLAPTPVDVGEPLYGGADGAPARIQVLNAQQGTSEVADQTQVTAGYLVVIDRDAHDIPPRAVVQIITSTDPELGGSTRLYVDHHDRGSIRWERDLYCVDDLSAIRTP